IPLALLHSQSTTKAHENQSFYISGKKIGTLPVHRFTEKVVFVHFAHIIFLIFVDMPKRCFGASPPSPSAIQQGKPRIQEGESRRKAAGISP
ncbi:MAG: hypothetical protein ACI3XE_01130, partial [Eubacteriales bacterium]